MKYYDVIPIEDSQHNLFDTITRVGQEAGIPYKGVLDILGFNTTADVKMMIANPPTNHFSIHQFLIKGLNEILRSMDIPLRVTSKAKVINTKGRR